MKRILKTKSPANATKKLLGNRFGTISILTTARVMNII